MNSLQSLSKQNDDSQRVIFSTQLFNKPTQFWSWNPKSVKKRQEKSRVCYLRKFLRARPSRSPVFLIFSLSNLTGIHFEIIFRVDILTSQRNSIEGNMCEHHCKGYQRHHFFKESFFMKITWLKIDQKFRIADKSVWSWTSYPSKLKWLILEDSIILSMEDLRTM